MQGCYALIYKQKNKQQLSNVLNLPHNYKAVQTEVLVNYMLVTNENIIRRIRIFSYLKNLKEKRSTETILSTFGINVLRIATTISKPYGPNWRYALLSLSEQISVV